MAAYLADQRMTPFLPFAHWSPAERVGVQTDRRNVVSSKPKNDFNFVSSGGTLQETRGTSEVGCRWCARSCDSGVIERKSPERGPRGKDRYGTITNPNPAGRGARGKAPRSPCIALRPRFGGASFLRPIQIRPDGYRSMAQRLSHDGACFYLARLALAQRRHHSTRSSPPRTLLTDPSPARYGVRCA
jgi:hypothetical protein